MDFSFSMYSISVSKLIIILHVILKKIRLFDRAFAWLSTLTKPAKFLSNHKRTWQWLSVRPHQTLDLLQDFCDRRGYTFLRLDGQTPTGQRQELVNKFNKLSLHRELWVLWSNVWRCGIVVNTWLQDQEVPGSSPGCAMSTLSPWKRLSSCISSLHSCVKQVPDYRQYVRETRYLQWQILCNAP